MRYAVARRIVRLSAWLVPAERRAAWTEEWLAELNAAEEAPPHTAPPVVRRALGAPADAVVVRILTLGAVVREWRKGVAPDARQALQVFRRTPSHAATVAGCLGLGLTAALGTCAVVNGLLFAEIPGIVDRQSLATVHVEQQLARAGSIFVTLDVDEFRILSERSGSVDVAAEGVLNLAARVGDEAVPVKVAFVSGNYFTLLGTRAAGGRLIEPADDHAGQFAAVVSQRFQSLWLAQPAQVTLVVSGHELAVVGVAEATFIGADGRSALHEAYAPIDVWVPLAAAPAWTGAGGPDGKLFLNIVARLPERMAIDDAEMSLQPGFSALTTESGRRRLPHLQRFGYPRGSTQARLALFVAAMMTAPLIVVMIACANVANLRLARASARVGDLAIRLSLGATRAQLVRLLVFESLALAAAGMAVGGFAAWAALKALTAWFPLAIAFDVRVTVFTALLLVGVTVLSGMAPALVTTRRLMQAGLRQATRSGGPSHSRFRHAMVATQVALSLALLVITALLTRSLSHTSDAPWTAANEVVVMDIDVSRLGENKAAAQSLAQALTTRLSADTRMKGVAYSDQSLFAGQNVSFLRPGQGEASGRVDPVHVTPEWFGVLGVGTLAGRTLRATDTAATVAVADATLAAQLAPTGSPVGMTLRLRPDSRRADLDLSVEIVGVVSDAAHNPRSTKHDPRIYLPFVTPLIGGRDFPTSFTVFARTAEPTAVRRDVARLVAELEPRGPVARIQTAEEVVSKQRSGERRAVAALGAVGLVALLLAATGLYAAVAYAVSLRAREIGIRLAVGARPHQAALLIVGQALAPVGSGLVIGLLLALPIAQLLRSSFVGLSAFDPVAVLAAISVLILVALAAAVVPAVRVTQVDPIRVLRSE